MTWLEHWGLNCNPLAPVRRVNGDAVTFAFGDDRLDPPKAAWHLEFYFDLYRWQDEDRLKAIHATGDLEVFNIASTDTVVIVLSGAHGCGRNALRNLLLWQLAQRAEAKPIVASCPVPMRIMLDPQQAALDMTVKLYAAFKDAGQNPDNLRDVVKQLREDYGTAPTPEIMFQQLRSAIHELTPRAPIVFCLDARPINVTRDMAKTACTMLQPLAHYIILEMTDFDAAGHVRGYLGQNQIPSAWVDAPPVDRVKVAAFLSARVAAELLPAPPGQGVQPTGFPFTTNALDEIFKATNEGDPDVRLPMRVVLREVRNLIDFKCAAWAGPQEPPPFHITAEDVQAYRSKRAQG